MSTLAETIPVRVGHSPDADDAFMFYALSKDCIDTGRYRFTHELVDIETLNRRAFQGELELTALSLHAYAHLADRYMICSCGASMGDDYGPMVVAKRPYTRGELLTKTIAVPGTLTTAFLALQLWLGARANYIVVPFNEMLDIVEAGAYNGVKVDAGLVIHEGQLTYGEQNLQLIADMGKWFKQETGLPLPLGANAVRKDLGEQAMQDINRLLYESIRYGLEHRQQALDYALGYGRGLERDKADTFVGMYVNDWTLDFGQRGRDAVNELLKRGFEAGFLPKLIEAEFLPSVTRE
jgi:1,4-dihydroxy-6-naphthoate synthase